MNWSRGLYRVWYLVFIIIGLSVAGACLQRPNLAGEYLGMGTSVAAIVLFGGLAVRWVVRGFRGT